MTRLVLIGLLLFHAVAAQTKPATIFLVRHAERAGGMAADVPLSAIGEERALLLARMLGEAGVTTIVTSEMKRTQQTATPLATKLGLTPVIVKGSDIGNLVKAARQIPPGGKALFVRHSNELAPLVEKLGGGPIPPLPDTEFDRLVILTLAKGKAVGVSTLRFGR